MGQTSSVSITQSPSVSGHHLFSAFQGTVGQASSISIIQSPSVSKSIT
ncbi:MAG: hypothetical protein LBQ24_05825 [Candidatus Peribacteria bacterium]|nr:hypothetical protein [Candidatus Peribacteria bacterium]